MLRQWALLENVVPHPVGEGTRSCTTTLPRPGLIEPCGAFHSVGLSPFVLAPAGVRQTGDVPTVGDYLRQERRDPCAALSHNRFRFALNALRSGGKGPSSLAYRPHVNIEMFKDGGRSEVGLLLKANGVLSLEDMMREVREPWNPQGAVALEDWLTDKPIHMGKNRLKSMAT